MHYTLLEDTDKAPHYASEGASGIDVYYNGDKPIVIGPGGLEELRTHLAVEIPKRCFGMLVVRSSFGWRGLSMLNSVGIIDEDYRGEIGIKLVNHGHRMICIEPKERVAQLVIVPYVRVSLDNVECLNATERGDSGFGSTGRY